MIAAARESFAGHEPSRFWGRLRVGQWVLLAAAVLGTVGVGGIVAGLVSLHRLSEARTDLFDRVAPANTASQNLQAALLNEESALRGYIISRGNPTFLQPFYAGRVAEDAAIRQLTQLGREPSLKVVATQAPRIRAAVLAWRVGYAERTLRALRGGDIVGAVLGVGDGRARFDAVRASLTTELTRLSRVRADARSRLNTQADHVHDTIIVFGIGLAIAGLLMAIMIRQSLTRPLSQLSRQSRRVGAGDFSAPVEIVGGSRDVVELSNDVDVMRRALAAALAAAEENAARLDGQARDLARSNAELEQFAYVASHDLQEPLRKVASFTQLLAKRYEGQLDERADQYIGFAVDGAKRMQTLINDLLSFSRVGRVSEERFAPVDLHEPYARAVANLATRIEETGATVTADPLPTVDGETGLLALLLQNLIGNAIKFHGDEAPAVHVGARRDGDGWELAVSDNGIGIDPQYADRIFVIFQRLHAKEAYAGTGIGLAMARKIVEYHGGHIWLDAEQTTGTCFRFTLPVLVETADTHAEAPAS